MKPTWEICKYCGQRASAHENPSIASNTLFEVLDGYTKSLAECLLSTNFKAQDTPSSDED